MCLGGGAGGRAGTGNKVLIAVRRSRSVDGPVHTRMNLLMLNLEAKYVVKNSSEPGEMLVLVRGM